MSPRSDSYLSLCLEQANRSPLHYRHGCIIIRGGRVIGQGYNTYRPGFDGGARAIKHGNFGGGHATAEFNDRLEYNRKKKYKPELDNQQADATFAELYHLKCQHAQQGGCKNHASRQPLLLNAKHVYEASKPTWTASASRQRQILAVASNPVASSLFKSRILKPIHLNQIKKDCKNDNKDEEKEENANIAVPMKYNGEKDRVKKKGNTYQHGYDGEYHNHRISRPHKADLEPRLENEPKTNGATAKPPSGSPKASASFTETSPSGTVRKLDHQKKITMPQPIPPAHKLTLIPNNRATQPRASISARTKDSRLKGANLYVARLGSPSSYNTSTTASPHSTSPTPTVLQDKPRPLPLTGSLHDELLSRAPNSSLAPLPSAVQTPDVQPQIRASRPYYRCIEHMHVAGIKRVFWTNAAGEWEGAKVRDLMDALESAGSGSVYGEGSKNEDKGKDLGVFVTKHEVLMLRRMMGC